jgi:hypothetical protein
VGKELSASDKHQNEYIIVKRKNKALKSADITDYT